MLRIKDDGIGIRPQPKENKGLGLRIMEHRAALIGGILHIEPAEEGGTVVACVPWRKDHDNEDPEALPARWKIPIVDDHPVVREGLAMQIALEPDLAVCGEAEDVPGALALLMSARPDLAIIDISLKKGNGLDLIGSIRDRYPTTRFGLVDVAENLYAERALCRRPGLSAQGTGDQSTLGCHPTDRAGRQSVRSEKSADHLLHRGVNGQAHRALADGTAFQSRIGSLGAMGQGQTTEKIATLMNVTCKTVKPTVPALRKSWA